jgi:DNA-binding NarL/FixJ family response regulator
MKQTNSTAQDFFQNTKLQVVLDAEFPVIHSTDILSKYRSVLSVCSDTGYIIDFQERRFHYVSNNDLFLCGHSSEEVMRLGYDFYTHIVHRDDLQLLAKMHSVILNSPYVAERQENIAYFSFTVRIKTYPNITGETGYQMVYHRLKPEFFDGKLCIGICMMNISVLRKSGNLRIYFNDSRSFDEYSFVSRRWDTKPTEHLTKRERLILKLSKQGLNSKEIAGELRIKYETLRRINTLICRKLDVETITQAIVYATNHLILFDARETPCTATGKDNGKERCQKLKLTPEKLKHIQECLDKGQSIRSTAKNAGVSEGCIRKVVKSGKLLKKRQ